MHKKPETKAGAVWHLVKTFGLYAGLFALMAGSLYALVIDKENSLAALVLITAIVALLETEKRDNNHG